MAEEELELWGGVEIFPNAAICSEFIALHYISLVILDCLHRVGILGKEGSILIVLATVQPPSNAILLNAFFPRILHF